MTERLKLGAILDERPVRLTVELPADVHRSLIAYGEALAKATGQSIDPVKLVAPMLDKFMASDRAFVRGRGKGRVS